PPYPRDRAAALIPCACSRRSTSRAIGVLPDPPTVRLPIEMTGAPGSTGVARAILRAVTPAHSQEAGLSSIRVTGAWRASRLYHQRGVFSFTGASATGRRAGGPEAPATGGPARRRRLRRRGGRARPCRGRPRGRPAGG